MFKKFIERIVACQSKEEAWETVFYGEDGIDMAFQKELISWKDHQLLVQVIRKMKGGRID